MKPHGPTVINERGELLEEIRRPSHGEYIAEFDFTNSKFLQMIDTILDGAPNQPVIIFQADHGTTYRDVWTKNKKIVHFDAYAAYYMPDTISIDFPKSFTLINTFPLVINELFETGFELRSDRLMELTIGYDAPFEQQDVTDIFAHK